MLIQPVSPMLLFYKAVSLKGELILVLEFRVVYLTQIFGIGSHTVTYSYTDSNNCTSSTQFPVVVLEANIDPVSISASLYEICNGNSTTISIGQLQSVN